MQGRDVFLESAYWSAQSQFPSLMFLSVWLVLPYKEQTLKHRISPVNEHFHALLTPCYTFAKKLKKSFEETQTQIKKSRFKAQLFELCFSFCICYVNLEKCFVLRASFGDLPVKGMQKISNCLQESECQVPLPRDEDLQTILMLLSLWPVAGSNQA